MKTVFKLFAFVICFTCLSAPTVTAQNMIHNYTNCDISVSIKYGEAATCRVVGYITSMVVTSGSVVPTSIPSGLSPLDVRGHLDPGSSMDCPFQVTDPCMGGVQVDNVSCSNLCTDFTVTLMGNGDIEFMP